MFIRMASVHVDDQARARSFYTNQLGFVVKQDFLVGDFIWLTVVSPGELSGAELLLEPNDNPAARDYQKSLRAQGIAAAALEVIDAAAEYARLIDAGVKFAQPSIDLGPAIQAVFDDTCGNLIQIYELK